MHLKLNLKYYCLIISTRIKESVLPINQIIYLIFTRYFHKGWPLTKRMKMMCVVVGDYKNQLMNYVSFNYLILCYQSTYLFKI